MIKRFCVMATICVMPVGCGSSVDSNNLFSNQETESKTKCDDSVGFHVCLSTGATFVYSNYKEITMSAFGELNTLVNTTNFQARVKSAFGTSGNEIVSSLLSANYIVTVQGYCTPNSTTLAQATVGGDTILYNECTTEKDYDGQPNLARVSGVLLHEISHNLGYSHADINPSPNSVPYYLGDLAESMLSTNQTGTQSQSAVYVDNGQQSSSDYSGSPQSYRSGRSHRR